MEQNTISLKEEKHRKMLLVLPLLTLPFITLLFWTLGGGKIIANTEPQEKSGFNIELPEPKFKVDTDLNKMSYYDQANLDSIKLQEQIRKDPNYSEEANPYESKLIANTDTLYETRMSGNKRNALNTNSFKDPNEERVYQKLRELKKAISQPSNPVLPEQDVSEFESQHSSGMKSEDVRSLEQMMSAMNQPQEADPQLKQLGGMLENILDIQHPARMEEKLKQLSTNQKGKVYALNKKTEEDDITVLPADPTHAGNHLPLKQNSFFDMDGDLVADEMQNSVEALVHETQTIVDGATIKLRLGNDVFIGGESIPKNSFIYGIASLKGERLEIKISTIQYRNSIFPVELSVYDMDGISGIYIPGAITRDAAKASADRSIQALGIGNLDDSWGAQAAGMGIEAAKTLLSKKVKLIKVIVKAGYQVLLYDEKQKNAK